MGNSKEKSFTAYQRRGIMAMIMDWHHIRRLFIKDGRHHRQLMRTLVLALASFILFIGLPHPGTAFGKGSQGADVFVIQGMLKSLGSYSGEINGHYDQLTASGVMHFQKTHGLPATGAVDNRTFKSIHYAYVKHKFPAYRRWNGGGKSISGNEEEQALRDRSY